MHFEQVSIPRALGGHGECLVLLLVGRCLSPGGAVTPQVRNAVRPRELRPKVSPRIRRQEESSGEVQEWWTWSPGEPSLARRGPGSREMVACRASREDCVRFSARQPQTSTCKSSSHFPSTHYVSGVWQALCSKLHSAVRPTCLPKEQTESQRGGVTCLGSHSRNH